MTREDFDHHLSAVDVACPLGRCRARAKQGGIRFRSLCLQFHGLHACFGHLHPAQLIESQVYRLPPLSKECMDGQGFPTKKRAPQHAVLDLETKVNE